MNTYLKRIQKRLKDNIEEGGLPLEQQFALIESSIDDLLQTKDINENAVEQHDTTIETLSKEIVERQKQIADRYHKTYEEILKL